jgi:hypothetical protein
MCHHSLHSLSGFQRGRDKDHVFKVQMFVSFQYQITATSVTEISSVYLETMMIEFLNRMVELNNVYISNHDD